MPKVVTDKEIIEQLESPRRPAFGDGVKTQKIIEAIEFAMKNPGKWIELEKGFSVSHVRRILKKRYGGVNSENAQFRMVDLLERGLKLEMESRLLDTDEGVRLIIEFKPKMDDIVDALQRKATKKKILRIKKRADKEYRKMREEMRNVG